MKTWKVFYNILLNKHVKPHEHLALAGDLDVYVLDTNSSETNEFLNVFRSYDYYCTNQLPDPLLSMSRQNYSDINSDIKGVC